MAMNVNTLSNNFIFNNNNNLNMNNLTNTPLPNLSNLPNLPNLQNLPSLSAVLPLPNIPNLPNLQSLQNLPNLTNITALKNDDDKNSKLNNILNPHLISIPTTSMPSISTSTSVSTTTPNGNLPKPLPTPSNNVNINGFISTLNSTSTTPNFPMLPLLISLPAPNQSQSLFGSISSSNLQQLANQNELQSEIDKRNQQIALIQSAYWSLRADFDNACNLIKNLSDSASISNSNSSKTKDESQQNGNGKIKLNPIAECEEDGHFINIREEDLRHKDDEIDKLRQENEALLNELDDIKHKNSKNVEELKSLRNSNRDIKRKHNSLEKEVKSLRNKLKKFEKERKNFENFNMSEMNKKMAEKEVLNQLYLNSNRIKQFMQSIKKYGEQFETLKKRQLNLTNCIGKEDNETFKIRMNDLLEDISKTQQSYNDLAESLDIMKTESQGKEFEVMTKNQEYIGLLEKEKFVQSSHLEEYVKKNQTLQADLTDREMKLRQSQNEVNFVKNKLNRIQDENDSLCQMNQCLQNQLNNMSLSQSFGVNTMNQNNVNNMNYNNYEYGNDYNNGYGQ